MKKKIRFIPIFAALTIFIFINPSLMAGEENSAQSVVKEFAAAYFMLEPSMKDYLNKKALTNEAGEDIVDLYLQQKTMEAQNQGYKISFLKKKAVKIKTRVLNKDKSSARILFSATTIRSINPLYRVIGSLLGVIEEYKVQNIITVVKENENWKIAPGAFDLPI